MSSDPVVLGKGVLVNLAGIAKLLFRSYVCAARSVVR